MTTFVRFTRWQALGWEEEPPPSPLLGLRYRQGRFEIIDGTGRWGPLEHFDLVDLDTRPTLGDYAEVFDAVKRAWMLGSERRARLDGMTRAWLSPEHPGWVRPSWVRLVGDQPGWPSGSVHRVADWWDFAGGHRNRPAIARHPASPRRTLLRLLVHEYEPVPPPASHDDRSDELLDAYRRECKAWANGVADLADEFLGTYDRDAACGPADLLPALEDVAQLLRLSTDPVLVTLRDALAEQRAASAAYEALSGFEDVETLEAGAQRVFDAQQASALALIAARSPR